MDTNPYTPTALPSAKDYLGSLGNDSNNEENNPYVGGASESVGEDMPPQYNPGGAPAPSMGPRFQAMADGAGMGTFARAAAPSVAAAGSALSGISPMIPAAAGAAADASEKPSFQRFQTYVNQYKGQKLTDFSKVRAARKY